MKFSKSRKDAHNNPYSLIHKSKYKKSTSSNMHTLTIIIFTIVILFSSITVTKANNIKATTLFKAKLNLYQEEKTDTLIIMNAPSDRNLIMKTNETNDDSLSNPNYHKQQIKKLFKNPEKINYSCKKESEYIPHYQVKENESNNIYINDSFLASQITNSSLPKRKPNFIYQEKHGREESAYLFDYLESFLLNKIVIEFNDVFNKAKTHQEDISFSDIYSANNQLSTYKTLGIGDYIVLKVKDSIEVQDKLIENLSLVNKKVDKEIFKNSINISQFSSLIKNWRWKYNRYSGKWQKTLFDKYDFNGDGRLNANEFLAFSVMHNYKTNVLGTIYGTNNYLNICQDRIDPIFYYADCNNDEYISAEELWNALGNLKRSSTESTSKDNNNINNNVNNNSINVTNTMIYNNVTSITSTNEEKYDIYKCDAFDVMKNKYRSAAVNDFILKNSKTMEGLVNLIEFRKGLLLGYLNRQVNEYNIYSDDFLSEKVLRWSSDGMIDLNCEKIKQTKCVNCDNTFTEDE